MTLKTQMLADQAVFFNTSEFAFAATYTVAETSVSSSINVIFVPGEDLTQFTGGKSAVSLMAVKKSDVSHPAVYDTVTIGAVEIGLKLLIVVTTICGT